MDILDLSKEQSQTVLDHQVTSEFAWTRDDIEPQQCLIDISDAAHDELLHMAASMNAHPLPTELRHPSQFKIPHIASLMKQVRDRLDRAPGVAVIDSMPLAQLSTERAIDIFWTIGQLIGRNVAQKWEGTMVYHVRDTGAEYSYGVRGSHTKVELLFHNDNAFEMTLPDYVGLLCLRPSVEGGLSRFCSLYSVHNKMLRHHPEQLRRLYRPVLWDRQAEHAQGEPKTLKAPVFRFEKGRLMTRANPSLIVKGYQVAECEMDRETADAVAALKEVSEDASLWFELPMEAGHIQYLNNIDIAHYRSEIIDHPDPDKRRHLVRSWHRDHGQLSYHG